MHLCVCIAGAQSVENNKFDVDTVDLRKVNKFRIEIYEFYILELETERKNTHKFDTDLIFKCA